MSDHLTSAIDLAKSTTSKLEDHEARQQAIDPELSYIVQAPAGSGKTSLLIQRFLSLLATVEQPEEIVAITFTRKAAEEMRSRLVEALQSQQPPPEKKYELHNWKLAQAALVNDKEHNWNLIQTPQRLNLRTIDSFCLHLVKSLPVSSNLGMPLSPSDDCSAFYDEAVYNLLQELEYIPKDAPDAELQSLRQAYIELLTRNNNDKKNLRENLIDSLKNRALWCDWFSYFLELDEHKKAKCNQELVQAYRIVYEPQMGSIYEALTSEQANELLRLVKYAYNNLDTGKYESAKKLFSLAQCQVFPKPVLENISCYQHLPWFLTTNEGNYRQKTGLRKDFGFPPNSKPQKKCFADLTDQLGGDFLQLLNQVSDLKQLPLDIDAYGYTDQQFAYLNATCLILHRALVHLLCVFIEKGQCDHTEIAQRALQALENDGSPSDLSFQLDCQIKHILVDEYQDTSNSQYRLLQLLTNAWQVSENSQSIEGGKTCFMVGDPMQSIYRFRQADVGIYLKTKSDGLGNDVKPQELVLSTNFRSDDDLLSWFNGGFKGCFPKEECRYTSAIPYSPANSPRKNIQDTTFEAESNQLVQYLFIPDDSDTKDITEARDIVEIVKECRREAPQESLAILVRKRGQAKYIIPLLRRQNIPYQATDIEAVTDNTVVRDLTALTKALLHLGDRIAWLALLRSPMVGLNDREITALMEALPDKAPAHASHAGKRQFYPQPTVWSIINHPELWQAEIWQEFADSELNAMQDRLRNLCQIVAPALSVRYQVPLHRWVEGVWIALGGSCTLETPQETGLVHTFFDILTELEGKTYPDGDLLDTLLQNRYAPPNIYPEGCNPVQILTIHKAKGLEYDTVILPYMHQSSATDGDGLLAKIDVEIDGDTNSVYNVTINQTPNADDNAAESNDNKQTDATGDSNPAEILYKYLQKQQDRNELIRLFYVATTRAKKRLYFSARPKPTKKKESPYQIPQTSLLSVLQDALGADKDALGANRLTELINNNSHQGSAEPVSTSQSAPSDRKPLRPELAPITRLSQIGIFQQLAESM